MEEHEWPAQRFDAHRTHLRALAYRMLGSISEAEDALREAWLRLSRSDTSRIENLGGWLTTIVGWVCLDMLRSRRSRRDALPEARRPRLGWPQRGAVRKRRLGARVRRCYRPSPAPMERAGVLNTSLALAPDLKLPLSPGFTA